MQEFTNSIKRPNLRIIGIEEGEDVQAKEIHNTFNKIITEASRTQNRLDQHRTTP
jgi:hypothetical protein